MPLARFRKLPSIKDSSPTSLNHDEWLLLGRHTECVQEPNPGGKMTVSQAIHNTFRDGHAREKECHKRHAYFVSCTNRKQRASPYWGEKKRSWWEEATDCFS